jgi:hypothetical protein
MTRISGTLHENLYTFTIISRSFLIKIRNISDKSCIKHQNTHLTFNKFFPENHAVYESVKKYGRAIHVTDNIIRRMRKTCWITTATDTHSEQVIPIAFPLQQWLHESDSVLFFFL